MRGGVMAEGKGEMALFYIGSVGSASPRVKVKLGEHGDHCDVVSRILSVGSQGSSMRSHLSRSCSSERATANPKNGCFSRGYSSISPILRNYPLRSSIVYTDSNHNSHGF